jgi:PAS domain S-box-containing protein
MMPRARKVRRSRSAGSVEERLEFLILLLDAVEQAVIATDTDGRVLYMNRFAEQLYGWSPSEMLGRSIVDVLLPADARELGRAAIRDPSGPRMGDWVLRRRDGSSIVVHAVPTSIVDADGKPVGIVGVSWDVTEERRREVDRRRVDRELAEKREQLEGLTRRLLEAQEAERRALARELHDDFGQFLTAVRLNLEAARRSSPGECARYLADSIALVDQGIDRVRGIALDLRPSLLDDLGLVAALRSLLKRHAERAAFDGRLVVGPLEERLPPPVETCSFRLAQEALTNVVRHASARRVEVHLAVEGRELYVAVRDDGRGFDVRAAQREAARGMSLGLVSMQERATLLGGRLEIDSAAGRGTTVVARLPIAERAAS